MKKLILPLIVGVLFSGLAHASEYAVFTRDLVQPYDFYKKSLALTSKKEDAEKAKVAVARFIEAWGTFAAIYTSDVPKPFTGISDFPERIMRPLEVGRQAGEDLKAGNINKAHAGLEEVRYLLWDLRVKANIVSLSDKANDFHEAMELVLDHGSAAKDSVEIQRVSERYAAWFLIKWDDMANAPDVASIKDTFDPAFGEGRKTVVSYLDAMKKGDLSLVKKLSGSVKGAYKKVWMLNNR